MQCISFQWQVQYLSIGKMMNDQTSHFQIPIAQLVPGSRLGVRRLDDAHRTLSGGWNCPVSGGSMFYGSGLGTKIEGSKSQAEMRCSPAPQKSPVNCACCFDLCFTVSLFHQLGVISFVGIDATKTWLCLQAATPAQLRAVRALEKQTSMCKAWSCAWMT